MEQEEAQNIGSKCEHMGACHNGHFYLQIRINVEIYGNGYK